MSTENQLKEFDELLASVTVSVRPMLEMKVTDSTTEIAIKSARGQIATLKKRLKERTNALIAPLKAQADAIKAASAKIDAILTEPDTYLGHQLNTYSAEIERKRQEALRVQREREEKERREAEEKRRKDEEALRARQDEERRAREAIAKAEQERIDAEIEAKRKHAEKEAADKAAAANLFGRGKAAQEKADREAVEAKRLADEQAVAARKEADDRAAAEKKILDEQQELERLSEQARIEREEDERQKRLASERKDIEAQRVKDTRENIIVEVVDAWAVPRELCRPPEVIIADAKKAYKSGTTEIPGLTFRIESKVSRRAESVPGIGSTG